MIHNLAKNINNLFQKKQLASIIQRSYHEKVIDHFEQPRNVGSLDKKKKNVGTGLVGAPACGDVMKLQIEVDDDGKTIQKAVFRLSYYFHSFPLCIKVSIYNQTFGCGSAIASSSYATEMLHGMSIDEAAQIKNSGRQISIAKEIRFINNIASYLKLPPVKLHCSMLAEDAIKKALEDYKQKQTNNQEVTAPSEK